MKLSKLSRSTINNEQLRHTRTCPVKLHPAFTWMNKIFEYFKPKKQITNLYLQVEPGLIITSIRAILVKLHVSRLLRSLTHTLTFS
jgi:hypothetical protein